MGRIRQFLNTLNIIFMSINHMSITRMASSNSLLVTEGYLMKMDSLITQTIFSEDSELYAKHEVNKYSKGIYPFTVCQGNDKSSPPDTRNY